MGEVAVLAAMHHKKKTGKGQYIEMSQSENIMRTMGWVWPYQQMTGKGAEPSGNRDQCICPADTFLCADNQFTAIAAPAPDEFDGLCKAMGKPELAEDPRFKDHTTRSAVSTWRCGFTVSIPRRTEGYSSAVSGLKCGKPLWILSESGTSGR
jgi:crotonobetainyl-CoA:carnitine CoA-transferase CaiB-like acyl-CoA transferase